jgi:hypothetical protein
MMTVKSNNVMICKYWIKIKLFSCQKYQKVLHSGAKGKFNFLTQITRVTRPFGTHFAAVCIEI